MQNNTTIHCSQENQIIPDQIYSDAGKGYLLRIAINKHCKLSPREVEVLSLLLYRTRQNEQTTKQTIVKRLMIKERSMGTILAQLKKLQLIESIEVGRRNEWRTTSCIFNYPGFTINKNNKFIYYRYYPIDGSVEDQNANRLYWLIVSIAKIQNRNYATFAQGGLADSLNMSKSTIKRCLERLRQKNQINWIGSQYKLLLN